MESINEYLYVHGTSANLIKNPDKCKFYANLAEARSKLVKPRGEVLIPKFVGVYQARSGVAKMNELEEATFLSINELLRSGLEIKMAIETAKVMGKNATTIQPSMISVLYDSRQETLASVNLLFDDQLQRISVYPINEAPNFSNKDPSLKELVLGNINEIISNEKSYDEQIRLLRTNLELMEENRKKYGLILEEWVFLYNSKVIWGDEANIREQKRMITELRKAYKKITKDE